MLEQFHSWLDTILEAAILTVVWKEYVYDRNKDDMKKHRKTKTTKKTTNTADGSVVEESTETIEGKEHESNTRV